MRKPPFSLWTTLTTVVCAVVLGGCLPAQNNHKTHNRHREPVYCLIPEGCDIPVDGGTVHVPSGTIIGWQRVEKSHDAHS